MKLGCALPGESLPIFGDALRRLASAATYLYQDGNRFWYDTQPTVTKLAEDRAEQLKREPDKVYQELERRLRADASRKGDFAGVHILPRSSTDVADEPEARLVLLSPDHPYAREAGNPAEVTAQNILEYRGNLPRLYRNALVFLAADNVRLQDLEEGVRSFLAWTSILEDKETLNLSPFQVRQAEAQRQSADSTVTARLPEAYCWLLVPEQEKPADQISWKALRLQAQGGEALAVRASRKLRNEDLLVAALGATILRQHLDTVPLWRGDHVSVKQLVEDFAQYVHLPRLIRPEVLLKAIVDGVQSLSWQAETFAYAERYDEKSKRYFGIQGGRGISITRDSTALIVKPEIAVAQMGTKESGNQAEGRADSPDGEKNGAAEGNRGSANGNSGMPLPNPARMVCRRFHCSASIDPMRVGRDAGQIAEGIIAHLISLPGVEVTVRLEVEAKSPNPIDEKVVRIVNENCHTLNIMKRGFEAE